MPPKRRNLEGSSKTRIKKEITVEGSGQKKRKIEKRPIGHTVGYKCKVCKKKFRTKRLSHGHECEITISDLIAKVPFSCTECSKKFHFKKRLLKHTYNEHSTLPHSLNCEHCNARCPNQAILDEHVKKVHERDSYLCPNCNKEFSRSAHVLRHLRQSSCNPNRKAHQYACEVCDTKFRRKDNLMVHMRQHIIKYTYNCKYCGYNTKNFGKLTTHWHKHHAETPGQFQCNDCGNWTSSRGAMTKHLEIHGEKKYECEICGYSTYTIEVIRRHTMTHIADKPFKCAHCDKSYIQRRQLESHEKNKHNTVLCPKCGEAFQTKVSLLEHMLSHRAANGLVCPIKKCPHSTLAFKTEDGFQAHLEEHATETQYTCEVCSKKFSSEITLRTHLETHTLDKPRRCMYCVNARAYIRGEHLVKHVRKNHPDVFKTHLRHVRQVLGRKDISSSRVTKSEISSIVNMMDAETDKILEEYTGSGVLYGGVEEMHIAPEELSSAKNVDNPLMSEEELADNLNKLLCQLIDKDTLEMFGWPEQSVDEVLEKVIEQCGAKPAARDKWSRVQRLRENSKHLFMYVVEDKTIANMLNTHTIDQVVKHIVQQVSDVDT